MSYAGHFSNETEAKYFRTSFEVGLVTGLAVWCFVMCYITNRENKQNLAYLAKSLYEKGLINVS
jgi:hypothetical protein